VTSTHATRREFAGRVMSEIGRAAVERWRIGAAPRAPRDITPPWLTELLGRRVDEVEVCDEEQGTSTRARLRLAGDGVPDTVFVKTTPTRPIERLFNNVYGLGYTEAFFYRLVAPENPGCTPAVYGTRWDAGTGRSVVVIEDLAARGTRFSHAGVACTADEAAVMTRAVAGLHRTYWESARFGTDLSRFSMHRASHRYSVYSTGLTARVPHRYDDIVDTEFRRAALVLHTRREGVARVWRALPQSLLHGDTHRGNLGFDERGVTLFDWQVAGQGPALKDLAYFTATSLAPEVRRSIERDLVHEYVGIVRAGGAADITDQQAWEQYRLLVVTGYVAAAFTTVFAGRLQSEDIMRPALSRAVTAVRDHDAFARLRRRFT